MAQKVRFDFEHNANFANCRTYRLVKIAENRDLSQLADQRITAALTEDLGKKGLQRVESGGDLLVGHQPSVEEEQQYANRWRRDSTSIPPSRSPSKAAPRIDLP